MTHYVLTSPSFGGQVEFKYNAIGRLILYKDGSDMTPEQREWMLKRMPFSAEGLEAIKAVIKGRLDEVPPDLTFDTAYNHYGYPRNRFRAEPIWNKLKEGDRLNCLRSFRPYRQYVERKGIAMMCFDRYLRERQWETDWHSLK